MVIILLTKQNEENWFSFKAPLLALRLYSLNSGNLQRTVKQLEDGRTVGRIIKLKREKMKTLNIRQLAAPQTVAMDESGRVLMVEGNGGLNSTLIFRLIQPTTKDIYHMYIVDDLV